MFLNNKYEIVKATAGDTKAIKNLFENTNYSNLIDLQFRRGENPYMSFMNEDVGAEVLLLKIKETGEAIGMGACSFHNVYVNGEIKRGGYLNGLKVLPNHKKVFYYMHQAFQEMYEQTYSHTDIYYATILQQADNVQKIFEKRRANMPVYQKQCLYTSFLFNPASKTKGIKLEKGNADGLDEFYERRLPGYNLAPVNRKMYGVSDDDFITWRENGKILASCAMFDNKNVKNYYLNGYGGILKVVSHMPTRFLGLPAFPKPGKTVNNANLSLLMFDEDVDISGRTAFIKAASSFAKDFDVVITGITDMDTTYRAFEKMMHIKYSSYLYTINWDDIKNVNERPIYIDVAYM